MRPPRETPPGAALGLVGTPLDDASCPLLLQASRWDRFQRAAGELASARSPIDVTDGIPTPRSYVVGHAAAHAFVAGVARVCLSAVSAPSVASDWRAALERLLREAPVDLVAVPGLLDLDLQVTLAETAQRVRPDGERRLPILFDTPRGTRPEQASRRQSTLADCLPARSGVSVHVVLPWARSHAPGRPGMEHVPGSALAGPLLLGASPVLAGNHQVPSAPWPEASLARLSAAGGRVLVSVGRRRQVGLFGHTATISSPSGADAKPAASSAASGLPRRGPAREAAVAGALAGMRATLEARLRSELRTRFEPLYFDLRDGRREAEATWPLLERAARSVLEPYVRRGEIRGYRARCDADTNEGRPATEPHVEVLVEHPQRVASFTMSIGPA